jgi:hypothetical protein
MCLLSGKHIRSRSLQLDSYAGIQSADAIFVHHQSQWVFTDALYCVSRLRVVEYFERRVFCLTCTRLSSIQLELLIDLEL